MLYTYGPELTHASKFLADQPVETPVFFFSDRWSINYETPRYLLRGHTSMADRSAAFGKSGESGLPDISVSDGGIVMLTGAYIQSEDANAAVKYPGATRHEGPPVSGRPSFIAYVVEPQ
jgi:hypothetical protein